MAMCSKLAFWQTADIKYMIVVEIFYFLSTLLGPYHQCVAFFAVLTLCSQLYICQVLYRFNPPSCHVSPPPCHVSPPPCHVSPPPCHVSPPPCHVSPPIVM